MKRLMAIGLVCMAMLMPFAGSVQAASAPVQMTDAEMSQVEGELVWKPIAGRVGYGAVAGGIRFTINNAGNPWSWRGFARSVGYGALGGAVGWNRPLAATFGTFVSTAGVRWGL